MSSEKSKINIEVSNFGSIFLFRPNTEAARLHLEEHCPGATWFGGALVCEHRYAADLAASLKSAGFKVE
jgi:hypothetical protein